jgi:hypothetical protein
MMRYSLLQSLLIVVSCIVVPQVVNSKARKPEETIKPPVVSFESARLLSNKPLKIPVKLEQSGTVEQHDQDYIFVYVESFTYSNGKVNRIQRCLKLDLSKDLITGVSFMIQFKNKTENKKDKSVNVDMSGITRKGDPLGYEVLEVVTFKILD